MNTVNKIILGQLKPSRFVGNAEHCIDPADGERARRCHQQHAYEHHPCLHGVRPHHRAETTLTNIRHTIKTLTYSLVVN